jgi:hypothetical protein
VPLARQRKTLKGIIIMTINFEISQITSILLYVIALAFVGIGERISRPRRALKAAIAEARSVGSPVSKSFAPPTFLVYSRRGFTMGYRVTYGANRPPIEMILEDDRDWEEAQLPIIIAEAERQEEEFFRRAQHGEQIAPPPRNEDVSSPSGSDHGSAAQAFQTAITEVFENALSNKGFISLNDKEK